MNANVILVVDDERSSQYTVFTNVQADSGKWEIYADDQGTLIGMHDDPDRVRAHLHDLGVDVENDTVSIDGDGNGSMVAVPISWIGDGEPLVGSSRVMDLIG